MTKDKYIHTKKQSPQQKKRKMKYITWTYHVHSTPVKYIPQQGNWTSAAHLFFIFPLILIMEFKCVILALKFHVVNACRELCKSTFQTIQFPRPVPNELQRKWDHNLSRFKLLIYFFINLRYPFWKTAHFKYSRVMSCFFFCCFWFFFGLPYLFYLLPSLIFSLF